MHWRERRLGGGAGGGSIWAVMKLLGLSATVCDALLSGPTLRYEMFAQDNRLEGMGVGGRGGKMGPGEWGKNGTGAALWPQATVDNTDGKATSREQRATTSPQSWKQ